MTEKNITILVLGEPSHWRTRVVKQLQDAAYETLEVISCLGGMRVMSESDVHLVVTEADVVACQSLHFIKWIRLRFKKREIPIIVIAKATTFKSAEYNLQCGANLLLSTPLLEGKIVTEVHSLLFRQKSRFSPMSSSMLPSLEENIEKINLEINSICVDELFQSSPSRIQYNTNEYSNDIADRYKLLEIIGTGASSTVYEAKDLKSERKVAVKLVFNSAPINISEENSSFVWRTAEAKVIKHLNNPHIVPIFDVISIDDTTTAVIMPLILGVTLEKRIQEEEKIETKVALQILFQITSAIKAAHKINLIHRDIKPANIMLETMPDGGDFVRLLDFGLSEYIDVEQDTKKFIGTPIYAAPEIADGEFGVTSDIYALGCLFYEMLLGHEPYSGSTLQVIMLHISSPIPNVIGRLNASREESVAIQTLLDGMMAKNPEDRFQSAEELLFAIEEVLCLSSVQI